MKAILAIILVGVLLCAFLALGVCMGGYKTIDEEDDKPKTDNNGTDT